MKINKLFLIGAVALGLGFTACTSEDVPDPEQAKGSTYASISIAFPKATNTRALPEDYNENGEWTGRDAIQSITVFLVNETVGTVDYSTFTTTSFNGIENGILKPNLAVKATPGESVKAYVVINDKNDKVTTDLKGATVAGFPAAFSAAVEAVAADVAAYEPDKDVILMTNNVEPTAVSIVPNVSEEAAKLGDTNLIKVNVERVVSRAIVTIGTGVTKTITIKNTQGQTASTITITDVKYAVGQSNKKFYILKHADFATPEAAYSYIPTTSNLDARSDYFDYAGLASFSTVSPIADKTNANVVAALVAETPGKFVLPVTHLDANYRKGNTSYFEIQATFTPDGVDGGSGNYTAGSNVFLGLNDGKFYTSRALAEASGQKSTLYKGGVAKYIVWLNPDYIPGDETDGGKLATKSPTVRNQVYHVHITGFKAIGVPNNPLNPDDPSDPENPENPIDPTDPLENEDTYLSVEITVLPYTVHSYEVDLGVDY